MAGRLRQSKTGKPGIARRRAGRGFFYLDETGARITDPATLARIKDLAIPPAWKDVWICPWPNGHIQALGTDDAGRRQYLYHPIWREKQDKEKFARSLEFGYRLPRVRRAVARHLLDDDPRLRSLAAAVRLMDKASLRTGADEYAEEYGSYGVTTLEKRHVRVQGTTVELEFTGKSGKPWERRIKDAALARFLTSLPDGPPESLLLGSAESGVNHGITATALNEYVGRIAGGAFTGKDFRTWQGTAIAARALAKLAAAGFTGPKAVVQAMEEVAERLNNTPAIARASYVDPRVLTLFEMGRTATLRGSIDTAAVKLLRGAEGSRQTHK
ncbi:DNA topoisomerase IB [Arthrobacter sp. ISL-30]|uniref:DNA topoisomerase IB n=1 Tax=Arthrobacter sp. ISL-30 TaxID=2819109 RepID=UPI001BE7C502|nr:DNA topoisomerase IB [Arthrobacter sp. ISL-30]MBT2515397.1 DNA topoisomerase IB [Arthrobacter sp. ISL-30]